MLWIFSHNQTITLIDFEQFCGFIINDKLLYCDVDIFLIIGKENKKVRDEENSYNR